MRTTAAVAGVGLALVLVLGSCGSEPVATDTAPTTSPSPERSEEKEPKQTEDAEPTVDTSKSVLPSVSVKDVADGAAVDLATLVPSDTAVLLWAWAPHCAICAGEAPAVEAFAKRHGDAVSVVGIGTQDDFALAEDFVANYGVSTPRMLWDPGFESWQSLEITGQPTWVLLSPGGEELGRWQGGLPESEILAAV